MTVLYKKDVLFTNRSLKVNIDYESPNKSFVRICEIFKQMGVKNYLFPLTLYDSDLIGYDVHNPKDPSVELKLKVIKEAKINKWYFLRNCVRIPSPGEELGIPYDATRANISLTWCVENGIPILLIQPRQTGKTIGALSLTVHQLYIGGFNISMALVTKDQKLLNENVSRIKAIRDLLPDYFIFPNKKTTDNKEGIFYGPLSNKYSAFIGNSDPRKASNTGRGPSFISIQFDEIAFTYNIRIVHSTITAAQSEHAVSAEEKGYIHSNIYTTTPSSLNTDSGEYTYNMSCRGVNFNEKLFYDQLDKEHLIKFIKENTSNGVVYANWSYQQLGKTDAWLHDRIEKLNLSPDEIDRDFLGIWKYDSENSIISPDDIKKIKESEIEPKHIEKIDDVFFLNWYITKEEVEEYKNKSIVIGLDSSENVGQDFTALVLIDPYTTKVIGQLRCNTSNIIKFSKILSNILLKFKNSILVPERKSTGATIIDYVSLILIKNNQNPFNRIFNHIANGDVEKDLPLYEAMGNDKYKRHLGFTTTKNKRLFLYKEVFNKCVSLNKENIYDQTLIKEMISLSVIKGRIDHSSNSNDDTLIAYLLAMWFIYSGKNLNKYKGLEIKKLEAEKTNDDNIYKKLKSKIESLERLKRDSKISTLKTYYQRQIDILSQKLPPDTIEIETRSKLEEKFDEERKFNQDSMDNFLTYCNT